MIACQDFVPNRLREYSKGLTEQLFFLPTNQGEYETFGAAIAAANEWIKDNSVRVVGIETVVLPNIWEDWEQGSQDPALRTFHKPIWHQFVRVWYEKG
jgi:UTP-glucose-1-phosphate uridylyltransferase